MGIELADTVKINSNEIVIYTYWHTVIGHYEIKSG